MKDRIKKFLLTYEQANNLSDVGTLGELYADAFMFGGNQGVQVVPKENFLQIIPKRKAFFSSLGLQSTSLVSFQENSISEKYISVDVQWSMHYEKVGKSAIDNVASATYILFFNADTMKIVMQIDHQDLNERVKELGLTT
jgi:hypothetical protein